MDEDYPFPTKSDFYNHPITAPDNWWEGLKVQEVLIVAGGGEVLIDGIKQFEGQLRRGVGAGTKVEFVIADGGYHIQPTMDLQLGYVEKDEGEQAKKIKTWFSSKL